MNKIKWFDSLIALTTVFSRQDDLHASHNPNYEVKITVLKCHGDGHYSKPDNVNMKLSRFAV